MWREREREPLADLACVDILFIRNTPSEPPPAQAQYLVKVALQVLVRPQLVCLKAAYSCVSRSTRVSDVVCLEAA